MFRGNRLCSFFFFFLVGNRRQCDDQSLDRTVEHVDEASNRCIETSQCHRDEFFAAREFCECLDFFDADDFAVDDAGFDLQVFVILREIRH